MSSRQAKKRGVAKKSNRATQTIYHDTSELSTKFFNQLLNVKEFIEKLPSDVQEFLQPHKDPTKTGVITKARAYTPKLGPLQLNCHEVLSAVVSCACAGQQRKNITEHHTHAAATFLQEIIRDDDNKLKMKTIYRFVFYLFIGPAAEICACDHASFQLFVENERPNKSHMMNYAEAYNNKVRCQEIVKLLVEYILCDYNGGQQMHLTSSRVIAAPSPPPQKKTKLHIVPQTPENPGTPVARTISVSAVDSVVAENRDVARFLVSQLHNNISRCIVYSGQSRFSGWDTKNEKFLKNLELIKPILILEARRLLHRKSSRTTTAILMSPSGAASVSDEEKPMAPDGLLMLAPDAVVSHELAEHILGKSIDGIQDYGKGKWDFGDMDASAANVIISVVIDIHKEILGQQYEGLFTSEKVKILEKRLPCVLRRAEEQTVSATGSTGSAQDSQVLLKSAFKDIVSWAAWLVFAECMGIEKKAMQACGLLDSNGQDILKPASDKAKEGGGQRDIEAILAKIDNRFHIRHDDKEGQWKGFIELAAHAYDADAGNDILSVDMLQMLLYNYIVTVSAQSKNKKKATGTTTPQPKKVE